MYAAQLRNLSAKKNARVSEIEKGRKVNVGFALKLFGGVEVEIVQGSFCKFGQVILAIS
jgi:hypothetical protein